MALQVLRGLDAGGKRFAVEVLVDPRAEKPDQRTRLGRGDVPERTPGGEHPAGGRVAQVHQVRQMRPLVQFDGRGDLDHLQERDGALLHAGAARARRRQQRQPLGRRPLHRGGDPLGGGHPDRAGQEVELAGHQRHAAAEDRALAGHHGLVEAGLGRRGGQLTPVRVVGATASGGVSQLTKDPSSSTASRSSRAPIRLT